ncbi:putative korA protein (plasmid) [Burkholderia pseudomallei]|nr:putative korA protein [Burkholderia pseudomallei]
MSVKQARVLLARFAAKAESERLEAFMQREKPKLATTALEPYSSEVRTLRDKGYTIEQIVAFFKENGVKTSPTTVRNFLRSIRA